VADIQDAKSCLAYFHTKRYLSWTLKERAFLKPRDEVTFAVVVFTNTGFASSKLPTGLKRGGASCLASESVDGSALSLESVDDVEGGDGLASRVLGVGDGVTDDVLEEDLEDAAGFFVDES